MRRFSRSLLLELAALRRHEAEDHHLALRDEAQRLEAARAGVVPLHEEAVDVELAEQRLGDEVVAALGRPGGAEVAAAHVRRHRKPGRPVGERLVDVADVGLVLMLRVAADRAHVLALLRVVDVGEARVVELEIRAAELGDATHLLPVRSDEVGPELVEVGVERLVYRGSAAAVVDHARRRDRQLRHLPFRGARAQEGERVAEDRVRQPDPAAHVQRWRGELDRAPLVAELHVQRLVHHLRDTVEGVDEVHVPRRAAELAVGDRPQADVALQLHDVADRGILGRAELVAVDPAGRVVLPRPQQLGRAQEAADVIGAEGRPLPRAH